MLISLCEMFIIYFEITSVVSFDLDSTFQVCFIYQILDKKYTGLTDHDFDCSI